MIELGIVDIREIIRLLNKTYNFDFSNFALTSLKYRLEHVIAKNNLNSPESLFRKLSDNPEFFATFLHQISIPSTEMFRDPSFWRWLREVYFSSVDERQTGNFKIWLPHCVSGGELYTLTILLKELNLLEKSKIYATCYSNDSIEFIKSGVYPIKKTEVSSENYVRFQGDGDFNNYYQEDKYNMIRDQSLIKDVEFIIDDINFNNAPKNIRLVLFRNELIYFNPTCQEKILSQLHKAMGTSGNLALGLKEQIKPGHASGSLFDAVNENESVYRKKLI